MSPCVHQNHIFALRPNTNKLLPQYLSTLLSSKYSQNYFLLTSKQTTNLASTNKTTIARFRIPLSSVDEQLEVLAELESETRPLIHAITAAEREISLLREFRTCLIADVVTGKLDVREVAKRLPEESDGPAVEEDVDAALDMDDESDGILEDAEA